MKKIYFAGGWFTPEQDEQHTRVYKALCDNLKDVDIFNPRIAGEITAKTSHDKMTDILIGNIEAIDAADLVVVLYDYRDTGTIWEAGHAYAKQKPIIYFAEHLNGKPFNLMLAKTGRFASSQDELVKELQKDETWEFKNVYHNYTGDIE